MVDKRLTDAMFALLRTVFKDEDLGTEHIDIIKESICEIFYISKRADMAHLFGFALEQNGLISPQDEYFDKFQEQQYLSMIRCEGMEYELGQIRKTFEEKEIPFVPLKGAVIRSMYPEPWMRTSCDIDVLVHPEDINRARDSLIECLGYRLHNEGRHDVSLYARGGVHVELHFTLLEDNRANMAKKVLGDAWKYASVAKGCNYEHELSDGMLYFYHVAHMAKHVEAAGTGMRSFLDLWILNHLDARNDTAREELLSMCSLERFSALCCKVSAHWFDGEELNCDTAKKLERFVLNCGTYGSEENWVLVNQEKKGSRFRYICGRLFLRYDLIKQLYPILGKHKWLMPLFQVVRWFKLLSRKVFKKVVREMKISKSVAKNKEQTMSLFLNEIGLK